jgi:hypothetical protein
MVIEELLEDPELTELEKCDVLAPLYHIKVIGLHISHIPRFASDNLELAYG